MCVCILILFCLFIIYVVGAYSKHPSIFFFGKHSCRKITDLCLCLVPFSDSSGLFVWPHCGLQHSAAASIAQGQGAAGPDSCSRVQLLIDLRPTLPHQIGDFAPCACSSPALHPRPWWEAQCSAMGDPGTQHQRLQHPAESAGLLKEQGKEGSFDWK